MRGGGDANDRGRDGTFFLSPPFVSALLETRFFASHVREANVEMPLLFCTTLLDSSNKV
jgi:hypothetical protein